jgi:hypothetical protein
MIDLKDDCELRRYNTEIAATFEKFDCEKEDINKFFCEDNDYCKYEKQMMTKSYCFTYKSDIVCIFTISNDSIRKSAFQGAKNDKARMLERFPKDKENLQSYPAVLIGRLGANIKYRRQSKDEIGVGTQLMTFIKEWIASETNKTGCRFLIVDAYNEARAIRFYQELNNFEFLIEDESLELNLFRGNRKEITRLETRKMFFDLITVKNN